MRTLLRPRRRATRQQCACRPCRITHNLSSALTTGVILMRWCLTLLAVLLPFAAHSAWVDATGKVIPDSESRRSAGDFGVQIVLAADEGRFRQAWNSSTTLPTLSTANTVRLGASVSALLIFHGCSPNVTGVCDVVTEFILEDADGKRTPAGGGPVWSEKPLQHRLLQIGRASMTVGFDKTDSVGNYKITANIKDRVSGRALSVAYRLRVRN